MDVSDFLQDIDGRRGRQSRRIARAFEYFANEMIVVEAAAHSQPEGHTFPNTPPSTVTINQHVYKKVPFEAPRDFTRVAQTTSIKFAHLVNAAPPYSNVAESVAVARTRPDAIRYGSAIIGSQLNLGHRDLC